MQHTRDLLTKALETRHAAAWARELNMTPQAIAVAKRVGRLSPVLAGNIAAELGEDPMEWIAVAALEAERDSEQLTRLRNRVKNWRRR